MMVFIQFVSDGIEFWRPHLHPHRSAIQSLTMLMTLLGLGMLLMVGIQGYRVNQAIGQSIIEVDRADIRLFHNQAILQGDVSELKVQSQGLTVSMDKHAMTILNETFMYADMPTSPRGKSGSERMSTWLKENRGKIVQSSFLYEYIYAVSILFIGLATVVIGSYLYRSQVQRQIQMPLLDALYVASSNIVIPLLALLVLSGFNVPHSLSTGLFLISYLLLLFISGRSARTPMAQTGAQSYGKHQ